MSRYATKDCPRQDCRVEKGASVSTLAYFPPVFDKAGMNINRDGNTTTTRYSCRVCGKTWEERFAEGATTVHHMKEPT